VSQFRNVVMARGDRALSCGTVERCEDQWRPIPGTGLMLIGLDLQMRLELRVLRRSRDDDAVREIACLEAQDSK
jgi:hypothetical protein